MAGIDFSASRADALPEKTDLCLCHKKRALSQTAKSGANFEVVARPKHFSGRLSIKIYSTRFQNVFISQRRAQLSSLYDMWQSRPPLKLFRRRSSGREYYSASRERERQISFHAAANVLLYIMYNWMKFGVERKIGAKNTLWWWRNQHHES